MGDTESTGRCCVWPVWMWRGARRVVPLIWHSVSQGRERVCVCDQPCSGGSSGLWRLRWPRTLGGAWEEDTEGALCRSWAPALNGGASGDTCGWPSSSRVRGLAAQLGSCFWQPPTYCPGPVPSGKTVLQTPGRVFLGALARRLRVSAQGCCHRAVVTAPQGRLPCRLRRRFLIRAFAAMV